MSTRKDIKAAPHVDNRNIWMVHVRGYSRFEHEERFGLFRRAEMRRQKFKGDQSVRPEIPRFPRGCRHGVHFIADQLSHSRRGPLLSERMIPLSGP